MKQPALSLLFLALPAAGVRAEERDVHSFSHPEHVRVRHVDLSLEVADLCGDERAGTSRDQKNSKTEV